MREDIESIFHRNFSHWFFIPRDISSGNHYNSPSRYVAFGHKIQAIYFLACSTDKNRENAASCDVTSFKLETVVEIFFLPLCRSVVPKKKSESEEWILVAMLARCQDKTERGAESRRILRRVARKNDSGCGKGWTRKLRLLEKYQFSPSWSRKTRMHLRSSAFYNSPLSDPRISRSPDLSYTRQKLPINIWYLCRRFWILQFLTAIVSLEIEESPRLVFPSKIWL